MNCIIVDDNKLARAALKHLIEQIDFLNLKSEFDKPLEAFNYLKSEKIDLVFLDIEMPEMNGIELAKNLDKRPIVILITAKKDYAIEAFEINVADYILKPVSLPRFVAAVSRAKELFDSKFDHIEIGGNEIQYVFVKNKSVLSKILIDDIQYLQALGDYVNIFTTNKKFTIHITLSGMEKILPGDKFYRLHRSYIVALNQIDQIEGETLYINHHPIPIGEQYKQPLLKKINFI